MFQQYCDLLRPFRREYTRFIAGVVLRQALVVGRRVLPGVGAPARHPHIPTVPEWVFVAAFVALRRGLARFRPRD